MKDKKLKNKFDLKKKLNLISSNTERLELCKNIQTSINNLSQNDCLNKGTEMSSKIIQQIGARL